MNLDDVIFHMAEEPFHCSFSPGWHLSCSVSYFEVGYLGDSLYLRAHG